MMDAIPNPAFPTKCDDGVHYLGMTLRDWFAGQALSGGHARGTMLEYELAVIFGKHRTGIRREEIIAADAYRIADEMLARAKAPRP